MEHHNGMISPWFQSRVIIHLEQDHRLGKDFLSSPGLDSMAEMRKLSSEALPCLHLSLRTRSTIMVKVS